MKQFTHSLCALSLLLGASCSPAPDADSPVAPAPTDSPDANQARGASEDKSPVTVETWTSPEAGFFTNSYWLSTGKEVVVFDAQFTTGAAEQVLADIRSKTELPVKYLVITHPNPDKFNGASVFQTAGAQVVASRATAEAMPGVHEYKKAYFVGAGMFTEQTYPSLPEVDLQFDEQLKLDLEGEVEVELHELSHAGVSSTQTVAWVPSGQALFVGDLIHPQVHAWLEGGIVDGKPVLDLESWQAALDEVLQFAPGTVYPGRGSAAPLEAAVHEQQRYLREVGEIASNWRAETGDAAGEDALAPLVAAIHKQFPDYQMGFMTEYSAYGLAASVSR